MSASNVQNSTNLVRLSLPVNEDGSVAVDLKPTLTGLLTQEYEKQLSQMDNPRDPLRRTHRVSITDNIVYLFAHGNKFPGYRFFEPARVEQVVKSFEWCVEREATELMRSDCLSMITQLVQEVLAFPAHMTAYYSPPRNPPIYGADLNSYFKDKFCKIDDIVHKILCCRFVSKERLAMQMVAVSEPTAIQTKQAFPWKKLGAILEIPATAAARKLQIAGSFLGGHLLDDDEMEELAKDSTELVKILQKAMSHNIVQAAEAARAELAATNTPVTPEAMEAIAHKKLWGTNASTDKKDAV